jgi:hypothetical protein
VLVHHLVDQREVRRADRGERALVDRDDPVGHERGVDRHIARDLEPAEQAADQLHDGRVARGARHRQVELQVELEEQVFVLEEVIRVRQRALALDQRRHRREVLLARVHRRELCHSGLEQPAGLEHPGHLAHANRLAAAQQVARNQLGRHEDATGLAPAHGKHSCLGQHLHGLAQGWAADPHQRGQLALGWQPVAQVKVARLDPLRDLLDGLLEGAARRDGLE